MIYKVIPGIDEKNWAAISKKLRIVKQFSNWAHLDIVDGIYSPFKTWYNPSDLDSIDISINLELHLMIADPEKQIKNWLRKNVRRIIVHQETIKDLFSLKQILENFGAEQMISFLYSQDVRKIIECSMSAPIHMPGINYNVLGVNPGPAGQKFQKDALENIKYLRATFQNAEIEIDGGINEKTIEQCKDAGANIFISTSYIWKNENPETAYKRLTEIISGK